MPTWITIKGVLYAIFVLGVIGSFTGYTIHERDIGEAKIRAADQRAAKAAEIKKGEVEKRAQVLTAAALAAYKASLGSPPPPDAPRLRCVAATSPKRVSADVSTGPADHAGTEQPATGSQDFDPGPAIDKLLRDDDLHIAVLEKYIRDCQAIGVCKK